MRFLITSVLLCSLVKLTECCQFGQSIFAPRYTKLNPLSLAVLTAAADCGTNGTPPKTPSPRKHHGTGGTPPKTPNKRQLLSESPDQDGLTSSESSDNDMSEGELPIGLLGRNSSFGRRDYSRFPSSSSVASLIGAEVGDIMSRQNK